ncbi:MAG: DUF554 domain-containing protein [Oscillospiraceae bacterium]
MLGVVVNSAVIILGTVIGLLFKKGFPKRVSDAVMTAVGLCVVYIGIDGALEGENALVTIISMVLGTILGTVIDIDKYLNKLGEAVSKRFASKGGQSVTFAEAFVNSSLLFCVGAMAIVGSLNAGIFGNNEMLFTKSVLDFCSSIIFASTLGIGVAFSAVLVFAYQGTIVLLAKAISPLLTQSVINELTCVGSIMIIAIGLNMLGITKIKVANFLPALVFPVLFYLLSGLCQQLFV